MKKWKCTVCGTIVESDERPDKCPVCKVPGEKFVEVTEEADWATEHEVGALKGVPADMIEDLRSNFSQTYSTRSCTREARGSSA